MSHQFWKLESLAKFAMLFWIRITRRNLTLRDSSCLQRMLAVCKGHRQLLVIGWLVWLSLVSVASADDQLPFDAASLDNQIAGHLAQLDGLSFAAREKAMQELAVIGSPAIRPLAIKVLNGSPEAAWRAKQTLELIGTQGNEETFYKSIGVLQLLYLSGSESLDEKIVQLQQKWRLEQKKNAIERLRKLGATITDPMENARDFGTGLDDFGGQFFANEILIAGRGELVFSDESDSGNTNVAPSLEHTKPILDPVDTTREIDKILSAPLAENRKRVLDDSVDPPEVTEPNGTELDQARLLQFGAGLQRRQILQNGDFLNYGSGGGITVSLDKRWQGTVGDLQEMQSLTGLSRIELCNFHPGTQQLAELAKLASATSLKIVGADIPPAEFGPLAQLPQLSELEFEERHIDADVLEIFSSAKALGHLTFTRCEIDPPALDELTKYSAMRSIFFQDMQIVAPIFLALERIDNLNYVNLSICKFETADYRKFEAARPMLEMAFTAQAFLGVRGGALSYEDLGGCEISEVVANSGAEKGGLLVGDQIVSVDGQKIEQFEDLRLHIAQHKVGEVLTVVVNRDSKPIELKIELTHNEANRN